MYVLVCNYGVSLVVEDGHEVVALSVLLLSHVLLRDTELLKAYQGQPTCFSYYTRNLYTFIIHSYL